jgi:hypothetical protein
LAMGYVTSTTLPSQPPACGYLGNRRVIFCHHFVDWDSHQTLTAPVRGKHNSGHLKWWEDTSCFLFCFISWCWSLNSVPRQVLYHLSQSFFVLVIFPDRASCFSQGWPW